MAQTQYISALEGPNIKFTEEGGTALRLINKTGAPSVKGQAVTISPLYDSSYIAADPATALGQYTVVGFVYEAGVADGSPAWIVYHGVADALLRDNTGAARSGWVRVSHDVAGRVVVQDNPGYDHQPDSITYVADSGSTVSGTLDSLIADNGQYFVISEGTANPGIDATFSILPRQTMSTVSMAGYYTMNGAGPHACSMQIWDWTAGGGTGAWEVFSPAWAFPNNNASTTDLTFSQTLAAKHQKVDATYEIKIRLLHSAAAGNTAHRFYLDKLIASSPSDIEHFKECGHVLATPAGAPGTDVLVRMAIHFP